MKKAVRKTARTTARTSRAMARMRWFPGAVLTLLVFAAFVFEFPPLYAIENTAYGLLNRIRAAGSQKRVALIVMDDRSVREIGGITPPRELMATVIRRVSAAGAKVITVEDIYSAASSAKAPAALASGAKKADGMIAGAMGVKARIVLPFLLDDSAGKAPRYLRKQDSRMKARKEGYGHMLKDLKGLRNPFAFVLNPVASSGGVIHPFDRLAARAGALGHINLYPDRDGVVRYERLLAKHDKRLYPSQALRAAMRYFGVSSSSLKARKIRGGIRNLYVGNMAVPADDSFRMPIIFSRGVFPSYSFVDVLAGKVKKGAFKKRVVLMGHDSSWIPRYEVPYGPEMSALEIRANVVENILSRRHIIRPSWAFAAECAVILYFGFIAAFIMPRVGPKAGGLVVVLSLLPVVVASLAVYTSTGFWIMVYSPAMVLVIGYAGVMAREYVILGKRRELIREHIEANRMLGLELQNRGMLDMAFEKFRKCPVNVPAVKSLLYNLATEFERKRMPHKAINVYKHILRAGSFKDTAKKLAVLEAMEAASATGFGGATRVGDGTMIASGGGTLPTLGRYEISRELGRGAMGVVYLGKDPTINRDVAIKTLLYEEIESDQLDEVKRRFFQEAEAAGKLSHPNIMTIFDAGEEHDMAYLAMEVLDGTDLKDYCVTGHLLPVANVLSAMADVADALDYAHKNGVVHRDIKPANIMLLKDGTVKVTDFGIARVVESSKTQTGMVLGTPSYMSPEQVEGDKVDGRSDIFSLGATMYELLIGQKAFTGDSITGIMYNITNNRYTPVGEADPDLPECVQTIVNKLLQKAVTRRYKSGADVALAIRQCLGELA